MTERCDIKMRTVHTVSDANEILKEGGWRVVNAVYNASDMSWTYILTLMETPE